MKPVRPLLLAVSSLLFCAAGVAQVPGQRVIITQAYGGGGDPYSPTLANDYVELYNPTSTPVNLSTYSIQYADQTSYSWTAQPLSGILYPQHYFLVQLHGGGNGGAALTAPDYVGILDANPVYGQLILVAQTATLPAASSCPTVFVTELGYGPSVCVESGTNGGSTVMLSHSSNYAPAMYYNSADVRLQDSLGNYEDAGVNQFDFTTTTPNPHSSKFAYAWLLNFDGSINKLNGTGITTGVGGDVTTAASVLPNYTGDGGSAIDASGNVWSVAGQNGVIAVQNSTNTRAPGDSQYALPGPSSYYMTSIAIDGDSNIWATNAGNSSLIELSTASVGTSLTGAPTALSPASGFQTVPDSNSASTTYNSPFGVAIDASGSVWVADVGNTAVYEVIGAAAPTAPPSTALLTGKIGARP